jgi:hypothetical protein
MDITSSSQSDAGVCFLQSKEKNRRGLPVGGIEFTHAAAHILGCRFIVRGLCCMAPALGGFIFTDRWTNLQSFWEPHGRKATTEARTVGEFDIARVAAQAVRRNIAVRGTPWALSLTNPATCPPSCDDAQSEGRVFHVLAWVISAAFRLRAQLMAENLLNRKLAQGARQAWRTNSPLHADCPKKCNRRLARGGTGTSH